MGFPSASVGENLPANAGDPSLTPGPGRSDVPQSSSVRVPRY